MTKLTPGKLRYLLTIASLEKNSPRVRCIDVAVQLGISRASVCKMLSALCREGREIALHLERYYDRRYRANDKFSF